MTTATVPKIARWPFYLGDAMLWTLVFWFVRHGDVLPEVWGTVGCLAAGAVGVWLCVLPHVMQYRAEVRLLENESLASAAEQIQDLEAVAEQISQANSQWQTVQDLSNKTLNAAREMSEGMKAEAREFCAFLEKANETEKAHLRLEVEKARRAEGEWLQVAVRMLDHTYALHLAAVRSGQPNLANQIGQFMAACRDAARRVGLNQVGANAGDAFDAENLQTLEPAAPAPGARIAETVAAGYTYQGRLIRKPVVTIQDAEAPLPAAAPAADLSAADLGTSEPAPGAGQSSLPL